MIKYVNIIALSAALILLPGCDPNRLEPDGQHPVPPGPSVVVSGIAPVSGTPIMSVADNGYAPLSFVKSVSHAVLGAVYLPSSEYPDIFVQNTTGLTPAQGGTCGLCLCRSNGTDSNGHLVYSQIEQIKEYPWDKDEINVRVVEFEGKVYAFQMTQTRLRWAEFDVAGKSFGTAWTGSVALTGISYAVSGFDVVSMGQGILEVSFLRYDVLSYKPEMDDVTESYYDSMGIYRGELPYGDLFKFTLDFKNSKVSDITSVGSSSKTIMAPQGITHVKGNGFDGYVLGNKFGTLKFVGGNMPVDYITDQSGQTLTNRSAMSNLCTVCADGDKAFDDFVTSGEGMLYLYRFSGKVNADGTPIYCEGIPLLLNEGALYCGSLTVPTVVDWDSDGDLDIVTGNSEGRLLFYSNYGTDAEPAFGKPEYLRSCGEEICFRAGYYEVQGPMEACWGYMCPNVIDWNADGLLDIVFSTNEGKFEYMLNEGTAGHPDLGERRTIMLDGLELYGVWRCRPAVASVAGRVIIMIMDDEDALHLYEKRTNDSVIDRGQVLLSNGQRITGYAEFPDKPLGYKGREKLELADWDGDGDLDLLIGTPLQSSFPSPALGLPWSRNPARGMQTLYMENVGNNNDFRFAYPKQFQFRGADFQLGTHANSACVCGFGNTMRGHNLLVGCESGHFYFFNHYDLTTFTLW